MAEEIYVRARATLEGGSAVVRTQIRHPMENGLGKGPGGAPIPAHHLSLYEVRLNGRPAVRAHVGGGVSKDPVIGWRIGGAKPGDAVVIALEDNLGGKKSLDFKF